jgi:hypothetical protein
MHKKNKIINTLKTIPEVSAKEKNVSKILQTLKEEEKSEDKKIKISFQFFDRSNELFNLGETEKEWFINLLDALKLLSNITRRQLSGEYKNKFQPHPYSDKEILNCKDDMLTNPQYEAWQLRLNKSQGRLHGFFVENTYYIRFLDRWHNMYDDKKYGGIKYKNFPLTEYDKLEQEYKKQEIMLEQYKNKNNELEQSLQNSFEAVCDNCSNCDKVNKIYGKFKF